MAGTWEQCLSPTLLSALCFFLSLTIILGNLFCEQEVTYIVESILKNIKISLVSAVKTDKHTVFKYPYSSYLSLLRVETI
jgi:hypothetical protein